MTGTTSKPRRDFHVEGHGAKAGAGYVTGFSVNVIKLTNPVEAETLTLPAAKFAPRLSESEVWSHAP